MAGESLPNPEVMGHRLGVLNDKLPLSELTQAYWRYYKTLSVTPAEQAASEADYWSSEVVSGLLRRGGSLAVDVIVALSEAAPDQEALGFVGAGVIEGFFQSGYYEFPDNSERLDLLEQEVRRNPKVRAAFQGSWDHALPPHVAERLGKYRPSE